MPHKRRNNVKKYREFLEPKQRNTRASARNIVLAIISRYEETDDASGIRAVGDTIYDLLRHDSDVKDKVDSNWRDCPSIEIYLDNLFIRIAETASDQLKRSSVLIRVSSYQLIYLNLWKYIKEYINGRGDSNEISLLPSNVMTEMIESQFTADGYKVTIDGDGLDNHSPDVDLTGLVFDFATNCFNEITHDIDTHDALPYMFRIVARIIREKIPRVAAIRQKLPDFLQKMVRIRSDLERETINDEDLMKKIKDLLTASHSYNALRWDLEHIPD